MSTPRFRPGNMMLVHGEMKELSTARDLLQGSRAVHGEDPYVIDAINLDEVAFIQGGVFISLARIEDMLMSSGPKVAYADVGVATITLTLRPHEAAVIMAVKDELKKQAPF